jgi:hypothetical protein
VSPPVHGYFFFLYDYYTQSGVGQLCFKLTHWKKSEELKDNFLGQDLEEGTRHQ